jgi:4-alpha-glucanotransferase
MEIKRSSGILLHPTSLPCLFGIGDLGPQAYSFINFMSKAEICFWEVLPLGPTGYGDSPYQCYSAFAGNPYLVSPELLLEDGLLTKGDISNLPGFPVTKVNFGRVFKLKDHLFKLAFANFNKNCSSGSLRNEFEVFKKEQESWLDNFALYSAIKDKFNKSAWNTWPDSLRFSNPKELAYFKDKDYSLIQYQSFIQFLFLRQLQALFRYAHDHKIKIIGDIPLFVAYDSADVWAHPELFDLTAALEPRVVAGVPPDYFSRTGQLWGNPLYYWPHHKETGYTWWKERFKMNFEIFDMLRLDHFRGFGGYWEVKAGNPTAEFGRWVKGPGRDFFKSIMKNLEDLPIIAENLGVITQDVEEILQEFGFPGMRIFQFGFESDANDPFLPHNYINHCVALTGTHDNATVRGWYSEASEKQRDFCRHYLNSTSKNIPWDMIRMLWASCADLVLAPMQDFLSLGNEARMNYPGRLGGNWSWRMKPGALNDRLSEKIKLLNTIYGRSSTNLHTKPFQVCVNYQDL